jgi:hypothetical protein
MKQRPSVSNQPFDGNQLPAVLDAVWRNTHWVDNALGLYEGVSKHADQVDKNYGRFFGLVQRFSLYEAALGICKLFDTSNKRYQKDTVITLFDYLKKNVNKKYVSRMKADTLVCLGFPRGEADATARSLRAAFGDTKDTLMGKIETLMPSNQRDKALSRLFAFRNKVLAHQQRLDAPLQEELKSLPSLAEMERLNEWAIEFCVLSVNLLTNVTLLRNPYARAAALNVVAKLLDKNFDPITDTGRAERAEFYSKIK